MKGFSLIELVVAAALLGGLSLAVSRVFFANMKGTEKTQNLAEIRAAGDQALSVAKKKIRNSREIGSCGGSPSSINIKIRDASLPGSDITSSLIEDIVFTCGSSLTMSEDGGAAVNLTPATSGWILSNCSFSCSPPLPQDPERVTVSFTLGRGADELDFSSTVFLRN